MSRHGIRRTFKIVHDHAREVNSSIVPESFCDTRRPIFSLAKSLIDKTMKPLPSTRNANIDELTFEEVKKLVEMEEASKDELEDSREESAWRVLLEPAARAAWRTSGQTPPIHWSEKQKKIIAMSELTSKELRRYHRKILEAQNSLQERRERERQREKQGKKIHSDSLVNKHNHAKNIAATPVYYKPEFTLATLHHRLLPNLEIVKRVLLETQALLPDFHPKRVLDFGIGVGSASAAAVDVFDEIEWIHGIDPSQSMRDCAERVLESSGHRITTDPALSTKSVKGSFDLVLFAYTATDLPHIAATVAAAAVLWEKLSPNGVFVMIEPGTPDGFSNVRSVRSMLLDCCPPGFDDEEDDDAMPLDQCHIIAPCTHNGVCPMERHRRKIWPDKVDEDDDDDDNHTDSEEENEIEDAELMNEYDERFGGISETDVFQSSFCSFVHNIPGATNTHKGDKMSYLVAQKRYPSSGTSKDVLLPNLTSILAETYRSSNDRDPTNHEIMLYEAQKAKDIFEDLEEEDPFGLSIVVGDENRQSFGRIVRAPLKRKGHVLVDYCAAGADGDGQIVRHRLGKIATARIAPGQYAAARKARWGGLWPNIIDKVHAK